MTTRGWRPAWGVVAVLLATSLAAVACGACAAPLPAREATVVAPAARPAAKADATPPKTLESLLSRSPELLITIHPPALARDPVYGPLLRRASELAAAFAGPTNLGTTALAVLERTEEVIVAGNDHGREAVVIFRGVPADLDPLAVVDTAGKPVWRPVSGDVRTVSRELEPTEPTDAALFIVPGLTWVIASGPAIARTRSILIGDPGPQAFVGDETPLLAMSFPGDALPQLQHGALASVGAGLRHVKIALTDGSVGLIVTTLSYADAATAASAEGTVLAVTLAFRHRLEDAVQASDAAPGVARAAAQRLRDARPAANLEWLGAAKVERTGESVVLRAPIPRPWLSALAKAEVAAPSL